MTLTVKGLKKLLESCDDNAVVILEDINHEDKMIEFDRMNTRYDDGILPTLTIGFYDRAENDALEEAEIIASHNE